MNLPTDSREGPSDPFSTITQYRVEGTYLRQHLVERRYRGQKYDCVHWGTHEPLQWSDQERRTIIEEGSPRVPLISGTSNVVYLPQSSESVTAAGTERRTFQVKPLNSVVLMVNTCSTTPVVFNLAFKTSTIVLCQREK